MNERTFTIVNPAAGGGRCGRLAPAALARLREHGLLLDVVATSSAGHAVSLAREAYAQGYRRFLAVGVDGTAHEIINGVFPQAMKMGRITLGFLPQGTGNSFLRDFTTEGSAGAAQALVTGRVRPADLVRLTHAGGEIYSLNLVSLGFAADVAAVVKRRFKPLGELGYLLGIFACLARLRRRAFPLRLDGEEDWDRRRYLFLSFNNSKFTGGNMMIAPQADPADGLIEVVRWGPIGRLGLVRNLPRLYDGTHIEHPLASRRAARRVEFDLDAPVDVMIDGEALTLQCRSLEILPAALDVCI